jgi:hypothetical protein
MKTQCASSLLALAALRCVNAIAQESGSITRQVPHPAGAVIVGAKIIVKNEAIGAILIVSSDQTGLYRAPQLLAGAYAITASAPGFRGFGSGRRCRIGVRRIKRRASVRTESGDEPDNADSSLVRAKAGQRANEHLLAGCE